MSVKDTLSGGAGKAKAMAGDRWAAFRRESPFFQARVGLIAAYVVVVVLTIFLAPPSANPWKIEQKRIPFGLAFKTAVEVTNVNNGDIEDAIVEVRGKGIEFDGREVPGTWRTKPLALIEGLPTTVLTEQLADGKGMSPPYSLVVETVTVYDDDKDVLVSRNPPPPPAAP